MLQLKMSGMFFETQCTLVVRKLGYLQNKVTSCGTLSQTLKLANFSAFLPWHVNGSCCQLSL